MKMAYLIVVLGVVLAGCGGSSSAGAGSTSPQDQAPQSSSSGVPTCDSLVGKTLTAAMEDTSCRTSDGLQGTAELDCKEGTMVAFGNEVGGFIGKSVKHGDFAQWPGCTPA